MHTQSETMDAIRAQVAHLKQMATFWRELVGANQNLDNTTRSVVVEDLEFNQALLAAAEKDAATAESALDAVPEFVDDEKTAPKLVLVHSAEPVVETVAEHAKPDLQLHIAEVDDPVRAICGAVGVRMASGLHASTCVECHDARLAAVAVRFGARDMRPYARVMIDGVAKHERRYQYSPPEDLERLRIPLHRPAAQR